MIRRGISPEVVRRQMRHANVNVTLQIYTQVKDDEILLSLPTRPSLKKEFEEAAKIIKLPLAR
jgi:integrase